MKVTRIAGIAVVALVGVLALGAYAFAQSGPEWGPPWARGAPWHDAERGSGGWHGGGAGDPERVQEFRADLADDLAGELGTTGDEVEAAFRAVLADRLQDAVEAGDIGQQEADDALAAYDEGDIHGVLRLLKAASGDN